MYTKMVLLSTERELTPTSGVALPRKQPDVSL